VAKHQEQPATVAGRIPAALGRCYEPVYLDGNKVFAFFHRLSHFGSGVGGLTPRFAYSTFLNMRQNELFRLM